MSDSSPCGKLCDDCGHRDNCPVTPEVWSEFLSQQEGIKMKSTDALNYINWKDNKKLRIDITPIEPGPDEYHLSEEQERAVQEGCRLIRERELLEQLIDGDEYVWNFPLSKEDLSEALKTAIETSLSPTMQERVDLVISHCKTFAEVARIQDVDEKAIRKSWAGALKILKREILKVIGGQYA